MIMGEVPYVINIKPHRHKFEADKYKAPNWREYNQALIKRGNSTLWF